MLMMMINDDEWGSSLSLNYEFVLVCKDARFGEGREGEIVVPPSFADVVAATGCGRVNWLLIMHVDRAGEEHVRCQMSEVCKC